MKPTKPFDLLILGGGVAGLTAAIFAARANLSTALIEEHTCGGLANWTHVIENFPSHISINGMELMERVLDQVLNLGVHVDQAVEVERLELTGPGKVIETDETIYTGKAIILATGRKPIRLNVDTDCERIHYCSVCDGTAYAGKHVLVVGGGNSGFDESLYLFSVGVASITLVEALDQCCASEATQTKLRNYENVRILTSTAVTRVAQEGERCRVTLENQMDGTPQTLDVDGIFVFIGQRPNTQLFRTAVRLDEQGYVFADENRETNLPGVFAAGDVVQKRYRYLTTAMADGTIAALAAEKFVRRIDPTQRSERGQ